MQLEFREQCQRNKPGAPEAHNRRASRTGRISSKKSGFRCFIWTSCFSTKSQDAINPSYFTWFWEPVCFVLSPQDQRRTECALATQVAWFYFFSSQCKRNQNLLLIEEGAVGAALTIAHGQVEISSACALVSL